MNKKILVVDDESSIRVALSKVLQAEDYEVFVAGNGQEAIEKFKSDKIDLLLLDLGLPVKDGWDTLIWLAEVDPFLPVIIITGRWNQKELAEKMGADAIVEKPLNVPFLLQTIRELINEPLECRVQRGRHSAPGFRHVPCDHELFLKSLHERYTNPFTFSVSKNH
jgi:DNA-binding response OmpR family regulator